MNHLMSNVKWTTIFIIIFPICAALQVVNECTLYVYWEKYFIITLIQNFVPYSFSQILFAVFLTTLVQKLMLNYCSQLFTKLLFTDFDINFFKTFVQNFSHNFCLQILFPTVSKIWFLTYAHNFCLQFLFLLQFQNFGFEHICSQFLFTTNHHIFAVQLFLQLLFSSLLHFSCSQSVSLTQYVVLSVRLTGGTLGDTSYIMYVTIFFKFTLCDVLIM